MRIINQYQCETEIRKSRFICILSDVKDEEEARLFIRDIQKQYREATHVCTAYTIGTNHEISRSSDNGEPAGTAGMPMLEALKKSGLTNVCACVVRYFGGIKLGTGGLARAYGGIVSQACQDCPKALEKTVYVYEVTYAYDLQGTLETWLRSHEAITDIYYDEQVHAMVESLSEELPAHVKELSHGRASCQFMKQSQKLVPLE
jgi:uncharacterized YigZ family protein